MAYKNGSDNFLLNLVDPFVILSVFLSVKLSVLIDKNTAVKINEEVNEANGRYTAHKQQSSEQFEKPLDSKSLGTE